MPMRVLIPRFDTFGDIVLLQPLLQALQQHWPSAELHLLVRRPYAALAPLMPPSLHWHVTGMEPWTVLERSLNPGDDIVPLVDEDWDLLLLTAFNRTWVDDEIARVLLSRGIRSIRIGRAGESDPEFTGETIAVPEFCRETEKYQIVSAALISESILLPPPFLTVPAETQREASYFLNDESLAEGAYLACVPGGSMNNPYNAWSVDSFAECAVYGATKYGLKPLFLGHAAESSLVRRAASVALQSGCEPHIWLGRDGQIAVLAALLQRARAYVGGDTGPMHIAQAVGTPAVAVFGGWTWPRFTPPGPAVACLAPRHCFGCGTYCIYGNAPCISSVRVADVLSAMDRLLSGGVVQGCEIIESEHRESYSGAELAAISANFQPVARSAARSILLERELVEIRRNGGGGNSGPIPNKYQGAGKENHGVLKEALDRAEERIQRLQEDPFEWLLAGNSGTPATVTLRTDRQAGLISVVIPMFNGVAFAENCVRSVWAQSDLSSHYSIEILLCDDGSTDESLPLAETLQQKSPVPMRILWHENRQNRGVGATRNLGISAARGEFIAFLDIDDSWLPSKLAVQMAFFEEHAETRALCSYGYNRNPEGALVRGWNNSEIAGCYRHLPPPADFAVPYTFDALLRDDPVVNSTLIARWDAIAETGGYTSVMAHQAEDWLLVLKLALAAPIALIETPLINYLVHDGSYTWQYFTSGLASGARLETIYQLLHWMLQHPGYRTKARWVYRKHLPALLASGAPARRLMEDFYRRQSGGSAGIDAFEAYLSRIQAENDELRAYQRQIEAQLDVLRSLPGAVPAYHAATAVYRRFFLPVRR